MSLKKTLPLEQASVGMQIADNLLDQSGNILIPSGATLTEGSINSLLRRGIADISVVCEAGDVKDEKEEKERHEKIRKRLTKIFRNSYSEEQNRTLIDYVYFYRTGKDYE